MMTTTPGDSATPAPKDLLDELNRLRARTRRTGRSWWFPLTLFGVLVLASCPLYPETAAGGVQGPHSPGVPLAQLRNAFGGTFTGHPTAIAIYWPAALVIGFLATGWWYRRQGERVGLRRPVMVFVTTGLAITAAVLAAPYLSPLRTPLVLATLRGTAGVLVLGITLLVLAGLERSRTLAAVATGSVAVAVLASGYDVENLLFRLGLPYGNWTQATGMLLTGLFLFLAGVTAWVRSSRAPGTPR